MSYTASPGGPAGEPFATTGPQGHRARMRARLLSGAEGLADYEILEMLLFLGIERRDTKPLAKALVNRFGSLASVLDGTPSDLAGAGLGQAAADVLATARESARRLEHAAPHSLPLISDTGALVAHVDPASRRGMPHHRLVLLLNTRNQLLAQAHLPEATDDTGAIRRTARRALEVHATAAITLSFRMRGPPAVLKADLAFARAAKASLEALSIRLHDHMVFGSDGHLSLRSLGEV